MNAVVLTVKASYVASTKYKKLETKVLMQFLHQPMPIGIAAFIHYHAFVANTKYRKLENLGVTFAAAWTTICLHSSQRNPHHPTHHLHLVFFRCSRIPRPWWCGR